MISALSAYKAMVEASATKNAGKKNDGVSSSADSLTAATELVDQVDIGGLTDIDSIDLSTSKDVFTAVDSFFNLGKSGRFDDFQKLSPEDKEQFVQMVAELAKAGYMGYEELVVNNKIERHDVLDKMVDTRLRGAKVYDPTKKAVR